MSKIKWWQGFVVVAAIGLWSLPAVLSTTAYGALLADDGECEKCDKHKDGDADEAKLVAADDDKEEEEGDDDDGDEHHKHKKDGNLIASDDEDKEEGDDEDGEHKDDDHHKKDKELASIA